MLKVHLVIVATLLCFVIPQAARSQPTCPAQSTIEAAFPSVQWREMGPHRGALACGLDRELRADPRRRATVETFHSMTTDSRGAVQALVRERLIFVLAVSLFHTDPEVPWIAAQHLQTVGARSTAPFLLQALEENLEPIDGSEEATLHSMFQSALAGALDALTGLSVPIRSDHFEADLRAGVPRWRRAIATLHP